MSKKTILITGASRGIGKELALVFASYNEYNLILVAKNKKDLREVKAEILNLYNNVNILIFQVDISIYSEVEYLFTQINTIDILINNAAIAGSVDKILETNLNSFKDAFNVNLYGTLYCTLEASKMMKKNLFGKIVNICGAGVGWNNESLYNSAYISSKYALYGLTESLSRELKEYNIDINCVSPGSYNTSLRDSLVKNENINTNAYEVKNIENTLAQLIKFLISDSSNGLHGKIFSANYDNIEYLQNNISNIMSSSDYTIRRIDKLNYFGKTDE